MSVTRQSLRFKCSVKGCPWPKDEEIHVPWCLEIPDVEHWRDKPTHQHIPKIGMGGNNPKAKIRAVLCPTCHDRIDNGDWGNGVKPIRGRSLYYFAWDLHGNTLIEREVVPSDLAEPRFDQREVGREGQVLSDGAAGEPVKGEEQARVATSAPSPSAKEEDDEGQASDVLRQREQDEETNSPPTSQRRRAPKEGSTSPTGRAGSQHEDYTTLTHEQRVAIVQQIKDAEWNRQWIAGDTGNAWITELGEEAEQYLSDFGYVHESLANILRVCAAIPPPYRNVNLRFSHHVVVYQENREDMEMWLDRCEEEQWSVAEFRRQVKGTKPRVKRWNLEELRGKAKEWEGQWEDGGGDTLDFLDWLGE